MRIFFTSFLPHGAVLDYLETGLRDDAAVNLPTADHQVRAAVGVSVYLRCPIFTKTRLVTNRE